MKYYKILYIVALVIFCSCSTIHKYKNYSTNSQKYEFNKFGYVRNILNLENDTIIVDLSLKNNKKILSAGPIFFPILPLFMFDNYLPLIIKLDIILDKYNNEDIKYIKNVIAYDQDRDTLIPFNPFPNSLFFIDKYDNIANMFESDEKIYSDIKRIVKEYECYLKTNKKDFNKIKELTIEIICIKSNEEEIVLSLKYYEYNKTRYLPWDYELHQ